MLASIPGVALRADEDIKMLRVMLISNPEVHDKELDNLKNNIVFTIKYKSIHGDEQTFKSNDPIYLE